LAVIMNIAAARSLPSGRNQVPEELAMTSELEMLDGRVVNWMLATGTRLGEPDPRHPATNGPLRTVVLVSGPEPQAESLDALLVAASDYDVIFVESIAHSYACIKRAVPDLVIISSEVDDLATCQLLSMLRADHCSSGIPVLTCPTFRDDHATDDDLVELDQDTFARPLAAAMN
jgi:hypothetical protein